MYFESSKKYKHAGIIKFFAALGAGISLIYHIIHVVGAFVSSNPNLLNGIIYPIIGIVLDILLLGSLELINKSWAFEFSWLSLLIIGILEAVLDPTIGTLLIVIAAIIALIDRI